MLLWHRLVRIILAGAFSLGFWFLSDLAATLRFVYPALEWAFGMVSIDSQLAVFDSELAYQSFKLIAIVVHQFGCEFF